MTSTPRPRAASDPRGPEGSDASLRAALETERLANARLRQETERQQALLRRRSVRAVLSLDRRSRTARARARREVQRGRRRLSRLRLLLAATPHRSDLPARRQHLEALGRTVPGAPPDERSVTMVVVVDEGPAVVPDTGDRSVEVVVVLGSGVEAPPDGPDVQVIRAGHKTPVAAARQAASRATGELLLFTRSTTVPLVDGWLDHLSGALDGDVVATVPLLVHPERAPRDATPHDLRTRSLGLDVRDVDGTPEVVARAAGARPDPSADPVEVAAGTSAGILVSTDHYREAGGLAAMHDLDAALFDLCARLRAGSSRVLAVPAAGLADHRPVASLSALTRPIEDVPDWGRVVERQETTLHQLAHHTPVTEHLLVHVTVAAPSTRVAHRWGDWHLAEALAGGLRRQGHSVHLHTLGNPVEEGERPGDVHLVLRGNAPVARRGAARHVLWIISHPESVSTEECDEADLVLVASSSFAEALRTRTSTPVEVVLQATDPHRFRPLAPDPRHAHAVAVVAMTRHVFRPVVRDAISVGLRPAIYGADWRDLVDPDLIVAPYVHNHRLPVVYSSVGVLLNDHWDTMRGWGFVSNRLYDALACETPIVSDHLPEIPDLFGDAVATYVEPDDLARAVDAALEDPVAARRRAAEGRLIVAGAHTFDHRAREVVDLFARHGLLRLR